MIFAVLMIPKTPCINKHLTGGMADVQAGVDMCIGARGPRGMAALLTMPVEIQNRRNILVLVMV